MTECQQYYAAPLKHIKSNTTGGVLLAVSRHYQHDNAGGVGSGEIPLRARWPRVQGQGCPVLDRFGLCVWLSGPRCREA